MWRISYFYETYKFLFFGILFGVLFIVAGYFLLVSGKDKDVSNHPAVLAYEETTTAIANGNGSKGCMGMTTRMQSTISSPDTSKIKDIKTRKKYEEQFNQLDSCEDVLNSFKMRTSAPLPKGAKEAPVKAPVVTLPKNNYVILEETADTIILKVVTVGNSSTAPKTFTKVTMKKEGGSWKIDKTEREKNN